MARRPRRVSSGSYAGLSPDSRAGLHASEHATGLLDALEAHLAALGVELVGEARRGVRGLLGAALREAYQAGTELETSYRTALELEQAISERLEAELRRAIALLDRHAPGHGIAVPTDRMPCPSEPPPGRE